MKSYRDRYDQVKGQNAQILAISADKDATQAKFRREIGAEFAFVGAGGGGVDLIKTYGVKTPLIKLAKRTTFVIGPDRKIVHVESGRSATDAGGAIEACSISFG